MLVVYDPEFKLADEHYSIAKRLNPGVPEFYLLSSLNKVTLGHMDRAISEARRALELEPASLLFRSNLGMILYLNRNYDEAERELRRVIQLQPQFDLARGLIGNILVARGDYRGALSIEHEPPHHDPTEDLRVSVQRVQGWLAANLAPSPATL